ncbi:hypothetical protein ACH5RR_000975 [Cinchona calisaya]|uniref:Retrotransposon gag domain-containing protein n=1 Tax=Cinchona calisaya TaxID=153742 RepID=A0ABD3B2B8_9GENT
MDGRFNAILRMVCRDKEDESQTTDKNPPLLPLPTKNRETREEVEILGSRGYKNSNFFVGPKLELLVFSRGCPKECVRKTEKFFLVQQIPRNQWVEVAEMYFEGKIDNWYQGYKMMMKNSLNWEKLVEGVYLRFGNKRSRDVIEDFNKLQQTRPLTEYLENFEELESLMLAKNPYLTESYFISSFVSGVKE